LEGDEARINLCVLLELVVMFLVISVPDPGWEHGEETCDKIFRVAARRFSVRYSEYLAWRKSYEETILAGVLPFSKLKIRLLIQWRPY
jgi:hypothetical protein